MKEAKIEILVMQITDDYKNVIMGARVPYSEVSTTIKTFFEAYGTTSKIEVSVVTD